MKKSLLTFAIFSLAFVGYAQQDPQMTFWMYDRLSFNSAAAGMEDCHCGSVFYRDQWDGFDRNPKTGLFNYNGAFAANNFKFGAGLTFFRDNLGQETNTVFRAHFAPKFDLGGKTLALGLNIGALNKRLGANWISIDPYREDPAIPDNETAQTAFDIGLGAMIYDQDKYYFGVSVTHLTAPELNDLFYKSAAHMYVMGGYNFPLGSGPLELRTNALVKTDLAVTPAFDLNANVLWNKFLFGGLTFRPGDAIAPMAGMEYAFPTKNTNGGRTELNQKLRLGYTYDITTSEVSNYSSGSHEFFVTYCFNMVTTPIRAKHNNPRFL